MNDGLNNNEMIEDVEAANTEEQAGQAKGQGEKKYTDADVDRIIKNKLAREREKFSKQQQKEQKESELDKRERELEIRERKADARDEMRELGLPDCVSDILNFDSVENYKKSLKAVQNVANELRKAWESERAAGKTPKSYSSGQPRDYVAEAFRP